MLLELNEREVELIAQGLWHLRNDITTNISGCTPKDTLKMLADKASDVWDLHDKILGMVNG